MKLYSLPLSSFAARVRLSIYRKGLPIEIVPPPAGGLHGEAYLALNPMGEVPTLVLDSGVAIPDSATILEYLEDTYPTPSLRPATGENLARARLFLRIPDLHFHGASRTLLGMSNPAERKEGAVKTAMASLEKGLSYIEHYLDEGLWAVGGQPSIADCAIVPELNAVSMVERAYGRRDLLSAHRKLWAYWQAARTDEINAKVIAEQLAGLRRN